MGYKTILICRRTKLINLGVTVREFNLNNDGEFILLTNCNYNLYVPTWKRNIETATIYKPNIMDLSLKSSIWENIDECCNYGQEYSKINESMVLVASVLDIINWH